MHSPNPQKKFQFNPKIVASLILLIIIIATVSIVAVNSFGKNNKKSVEIANNNSESSSSLSESSSSQESSQSQESSLSANSVSSQASSSAKSTTTNSKYKQFSGLEFQNLYETVSSNYTGVTKSSQKPAITGNTEADQQIQTLAENKGYKLRAESTNKKINSVAQTTTKSDQKCRQKRGKFKLCSSLWISLGC